MTLQVRPAGDRSALNPDKATLRDEVRRMLGLLIAAAATFGLAQVATGLAFGSLRTLIAGILFAALAAWLTAFPRRALGWQSGRMRWS